MVRAWYMSDIVEGSDPTAPNMKIEDEFVTLDEVRQKTGITVHNINADTWETDEEYATLKKTNGYTYEDVCEITSAIPAEKLKIFFTEHIHSDEEIRFILDGTGYFDVRDKEDKWIRLEIKKSDLIILPAGIYHRFTLDCNKYVKCKRLFIGEPVWTPINRPEADNHPKHIEHLSSLTA